MSESDSQRPPGDTLSVASRFAITRTHPDEAHTYDGLKQRLAEAFPNDITSYTDGKASFISDIHSRAALWLSSRPCERSHGSK